MNSRHSCISRACPVVFCLAAGTLPVTSIAAEAAAASGTIEEVLVTGSRITRANLTQPNPVYGLDADDIKLSGQTSVIDLIDDLPQLFSSQNGTQSGFFTEDGIDNTPGLSQLELRGLGANRTLVLVDGKRHVAGQAGTASVDVGTIPAALIERVEVLTGGASAIYGADAVTGVVNFIMKDDFEGTQIDVVGGIADDSGGEEWQVSFTHGMNLFDDRLNVTVNAVARRHEDIAYGDRRWSRDSGIAGIQNNNWRQFFQNGDSMPAGASLGAPIASTSNGTCTANFPGTPQALVDRACNAAPQAVERNMRFGLSSPNGLLSLNLADDITAGTPTRATAFPFFHTEADLADLAPGTPVMDFNNNGIDDCTESYVGAFAVGGCVIVDRDGNLRPLNPGIVDGDINFDAIGSDGSPQNGADNQSLDPRFGQYAVNVLLNFAVTDAMNLFADVKYVTSETSTYGGTISFEDTINISPENPFVPAPMRALMNEILALNPQFADTAQFFMSRDPEDIHNDGDYERETFRIVAGVDGTFLDDWTYEASLNYGRTKEDADSQALLPDRYFAALDVVTDGNGNPVCRSEVEPGWTVDDFNNGSIFGDTGVNTFTPGDGRCAPANPFGYGTISEDAQDFIAPWRNVDDELEQFVASFIVTGNSSRWFSLPAGPVEFATGLEYRDERSESIPEPFEQEGFYFNSQTSPIEGDFDVQEVFIEASVPLIADRSFTRELTVDGAYRYSDYSLPVGSTNTWSAGVSWAPIDDIRFRGTISRAVRAPNIFELFSPRTRTIFNLDIDPCDATEIAALTDPVVQANRTANCAADPLVGAGFENPLTSNFPGVTGGNQDLIEETSDTQTAGVVIQPRFLDGLTITADWWQIEIEDAIQTVQDEDVLRGCYDGPSLDPTFCSLFTRIADPSSAFFGGLNFLETGQVNFASLETQGVDFEITYTMDFIGGLLALRLNGTWLDELEEFRSALNPEEGDIETREMRLPEWAGNFGARWSNDRFTADYRARYIGNQYHRNIEENLADSFDNASSGVLWVHDISGNYQINQTFTAYGGVQNFTDEKPFDTQPSYPTGPRGRYWYFGVTAQLGAAAL